MVTETWEAAITLCEHATGLIMTGVTIVTGSVHAYSRLIYELGRE